MSDLISRSEVLKTIDENGYVNCKDQKDFFTNCRIDRIRQNVVEMPTSFDLDKVIVELEKERDNCYEQMKKIEEKEDDDMDYFDGNIFDECHYQSVGLNKAIEIIKKYFSGTTEPPKTD